jgi:hypothetical protein
VNLDIQAEFERRLGELIEGRAEPQLEQRALATVQLQTVIRIAHCLEDLDIAFVEFPLRLDYTQGACLDHMGKRYVLKRARRPRELSQIPCHALPPVSERLYQR